MDKDSQVIVKETEDKKRKDTEKSSTATETEEKEISLPSSEPPDKTSPKTEIDLTHASSDADRVVHTMESDGSDEYVSARTEEKTSPEDGRIAVMNPNDVVFETETQPEEGDHQKKTEKEISDIKKSFTSRSPAGKPIQSDGLDRKPLLSTTLKDSERSRTAKKKTAPKRTSAKPIKPISQPITMSKGVAYLSGNIIRLIGGVKLSPGDEIKIKDKEFVLRAKPRRNTIIHVSAICLLFLGLILFTPLFKSHNYGRLIGIVLEENTRTPIPQAKIFFKEMGKTVKSNELGFFMFESMPPGMYTLETSATGHQPTRENVTITKDQSTTISMQLSPLVNDDRSAGSHSTVSTPTEGSQEISSSDVSANTDYGAIKIKSNVSDPVIQIDHQLIGTGNKVYRKIEPGKHVVTATKEGYYDWAGEVNVTPGKTMNLEIALSEDKSYHSATQTWKDYLTLGQTQLNSNDFTSALASYNQALALQPDAPEALLGRGQTHSQMGEKSKALEDLEKAAQLFVNESNYSSAMLCYNDLIVLKDVEPKYFLNRGICSLKLGQYQKSIQDLNKAIELDPKLFSGYLDLGEAYYQDGNYKLSIETYKQARKLNEKNPQVYVGLTKAYYAKKDKSEAKKSYKKFEELSTYMDREKMKENPEWRGILKGIGIE